MNDVEQFIRAAATKRGIDPNIAVRVAMSEGGVSDPFRQSDVKAPYGREESFGPFQLLMRGGLGAAALQHGIDPRKDWKGGVEFALDHVARTRSWGDFHGAANTGIANTAGLSGASKAAGVSRAPQSQKLVPGTSQAIPPEQLTPDKSNKLVPGTSEVIPPEQLGAPADTTPADTNPGSDLASAFANALGNASAGGSGGGGPSNFIPPGDNYSLQTQPVSASAEELAQPWTTSEQSRTPSQLADLFTLPTIGQPASRLKALRDAQSGLT